MLSDDFDVSTAAFRVGYESPSQFSREYSRFSDCHHAGIWKACDSWHPNPHEFTSLFEGFPEVVHHSRRESSKINGPAWLNQPAALPKQGGAGDRGLQLR